MGDFSRREQVEESDVVGRIQLGEDWLYMESAFLRQSSCSEPCLLAFAWLPVLLGFYLPTIHHLVHSAVRQESRDSPEQITSL